MSNSPSITVLMLCWNHSRFIAQSLSSLAKQTDREFKIVFLDNASTDRSATVAQEFMDINGLNGKVLINDKPRGVSANLNKLLAHSDSDIVCVISADDWYHPKYISAVRRTSKAFPCASLYYPMAYHFDDANGLISDRPAGRPLSGNLWEYTRKLDWRFGFVGLAYRRSALLEIGGWDEQLLAEDNDLLFRLSKNRAYIFIPKRLFYYRVSPSSISSDHVFVIKSWRQFFDKHRAYFPNRHRLLLSYTKSHIRLAIKKRRYRDAVLLLPTIFRSLIPAFVLR